MFIHESLIVIQLQQLTHGRLILFSRCIIFHKCLNQTLNSMIPTLNMAWKVKVKSINPIWLFVTLSTVAHQASCPRDFPGKNTGVGCHFLLQGVFLTQGLNSGLLHCRQTLHPLSHQGIPNMAWRTHKILELHTEEKLEGILDVYVGPGEKFISVYFYDEKNIAI